MERGNLGTLLALSMLAGLAVGDGADPMQTGAKLHAGRKCPRCGAKAMWSKTTAYCTKSRCGWFEVVPPKESV